MDLSPSLDLLAKDAAVSSAGISVRCAAANFRWEQAVTAERAAQYGADVGEVTTHRDWKAGHESYLKSLVHVAKDHPRSAESFAAVNTKAHLNENLDNTFLIRLESLNDFHLDGMVASFAADFWQRFYKSQKDLRKAKLSAGDEAMRAEFIGQWNAKRTQARPQFAAFLNDFGGSLDELVKLDWPHLLRDRLGLAHWPSTAGKSLPVALMCYTLDDVREARSDAVRKGAVASFSRPTVLDGEFSWAFVPAPLAPGNESYGYTLDLAATKVPLEFMPELLTFPIDYQPRHLKALGYISTPHALMNEGAVLAARNRHVQGLRKRKEYADFGEVLA